MEALIADLRTLAANPYAWLVAGALGLLTLHSLVRYLRCPLVHRTATIAPEDARAAVEAERVHSPRHLALMVLGIALAVGGMAMVASSVRPPLALALIAAGLFLTQTEPLRLNIRDRQLRVIAAELDSEAARHAAIERLRGEYHRLIAAHALLAVAVTLYILVF